MRWPFRYSTDVHQAIQDFEKERLRNQQELQELCQVIEHPNDPHCKDKKKYLED